MKASSARFSSIKTGGNNGSLLSDRILGLTRDNMEKYSTPAVVRWQRHLVRASLGPSPKGVWMGGHRHLERTGIHRIGNPALHMVGGSLGAQHPPEDTTSYQKENMSINTIGKGLTELSCSAPVKDAVGIARRLAQSPYRATGAPRTAWTDLSTTNVKLNIDATDSTTTP